MAAWSGGAQLAQWCSAGPVVLSCLSGSQLPQWFSAASVVLSWPGGAQLAELSSGTITVTAEPSARSWPTRPPPRHLSHAVSATRPRPRGLRRKS